MIFDHRLLLLVVSAGEDFQLFDNRKLQEITQFSPGKIRIQTPIPVLPNSKVASFV